MPARASGDGRALNNFRTAVRLAKSGESRAARSGFASTTGS